MKNKKSSLFKSLNKSSIFLLLMGTIAILVTSLIHEYIEYNKAVKDLKITYTNDVKEKLQWSVEHYINLIKIEKNNITKTRKEILKARVEHAHMLANDLFKKYKNSKSLPEIKEIIIAALREIRFNYSGYYFVVQTDGKVVLNDEVKNYEQNNLLEMHNQDNVYFIKEMISLVKKEKEGFYRYKWQKPDKQKTQIDKISYIKVFEPFGWIIGTGIYEDDLNKIVQKSILKNILPLKFDKEKDSHVFIGQWDGLIHSYPAKGKNMYDIQDKNGKYIVRELIKKAKHNGGFVDYIMPALGHEKTKLKLSYVQGIPEWKWFVGAGLYVDDIETKIAPLKVSTTNEYIRLITNYLVISILVIVLFFFIFKKLHKKAESDFMLFQQFLQNLSVKKESIDIENIEFEEFEEIALYANKMLHEKVELEDYLKKYETIVSTSKDFIALIDKNYIFHVVNETYSLYFNKPKEEILGHHVKEVFGEENFQNNIKSLHDRVLAGESFSFETWVNFPRGKRCISVHYSPYIKDGQNKVEFFVVVGRDVTDKKEDQKQLEHIAHHDILTNLPNRILLNDRIMQAINNANREGTIVALCFIDLDNFKKINDAFGHAYGDDVLKQVTKRIQSSLRQTDTLSRIGGDEFILLLEHLNDVSEVEKILDKVQRNFEKPFISHNQKFFPTASIGISVYPQDGKNSEDLIKNADIAMYEAKDNGKNSYKFFKQEMGLIPHKLVSMESTLKEAIQEEQFIVYYQPQVDLKTGKISGLEVLIRLQHPQKGLLLPAEFIQIAEDTQMIIPIGEFILRQACLDVMALKNDGVFNGNVAINISGRQIEHSDFLATLKKVIEFTKINPDKIELELTESVLMKDAVHWSTLLEQIKQIGVKIAIDDFGTGYSSLSYLHKLPIDKLKIDMSFVRDIPLKEDACMIANTIITLSDTMGMKTIAEGIETKEQEQYLRANSCEEGQGYLYSKPMSLEALRKWLQ